MTKKEMIKQIIRNFHLQGSFNTRPRRMTVPLNTGKIIVLTGVRRCGKTSILYHTMNTLAKDMDKTRILFINFEDERLNLSANELDLVMQSYSELYPEQSLEDIYLFFDEAQNVPGWERFVRRVYDTITRNIFITGSNSRMLGSEIATGLRGRTLRLEVYPLSFAEYLEFKNIEADLHSPRHLAFIRKAQEDYLQYGGFPEALFIEKEYRLQLLQEYFNVLLYRDIAERYRVQNLPALKFFLKRVISSTTKQLSIHKIYNDLKSANIRIGKNSLYDFLDYARDSYLALTVHRFDPSLAARELGEKKVYAIDNGICEAVEYRFSMDQGKTLENAVFLELQRAGHDLFYFRDDSGECDFLMTDRGRVTGAIQVCQHMDDEATKKRELKGLTRACARFSLDRAVIVTGDTLDGWEVEGLQIDVVPFYRYFGTIP